MDCGSDAGLAGLALRLTVLLLPLTPPLVRAPSSEAEIAVKAEQAEETHELATGWNEGQGQGHDLPAMHLVSGVGVDPDKASDRELGQ